MPYAFTGTRAKLGVVLEPEKLSQEEQERLATAGLLGMDVPATLQARADEVVE